MPSKKPNFSKSERFADVKKLVTPGPGTYKETQAIGYNSVVGGNSKAGFTMRPKTNNMNTSVAVPGPGTYAQNSIIGHKNLIHPSSPSKSFSPILNQARGITVVPGPGTYEQKQDILKKKSPAFTMRAKTVDPKNKDLAVPGPNAYNPSDKTSSTKAKAASYTMRKKTEDLTSGRTITPGPNYDPRPAVVKPKAPSFSMRKKLEPLKDSVETPGPGAHTPSLENVYTKSPLARRGR